MEVAPLKAVCFDCGKVFGVWKNPQLCHECEQEERARQRAKGIVVKSRRPRSLTAKVPFRPVAAVPSLAMRLYGKRAAHG